MRILDLTAFKISEPSEFSGTSSDNNFHYAPNDAFAIKCFGELLAVYWDLLDSQELVFWDTVPELQHIHTFVSLKSLHGSLPSNLRYNADTP